MSERTLEVLSWQQAEHCIATVNPELAELIRNISPGESCKIVKATYNFGDDIVKNGILNLPFKGKLEPVTSNNLPNNIVDDLSYSNIPVGFSIDKDLEVYFNKDGNITPYDVCTPGFIFSLRSILPKDSAHGEFRKSWNMTAGARSLYLLPKISDTRSFNRLKKEFCPSMKKPKNIADQWDVFKAVSDNSGTNDKWTVDVFFMTRQWFDEAYNKRFDELRLFAFTTIWRFYSYLTNGVSFKFNISSLLQGTKLKPNPYIIDTLHHLYSVRQDFFPGFSVADEMIAPIDLFEDVLLDVYRISDIPIFMTLKRFSETENNCVYYSFKVPCLMEFAPKSRQVSRKTDILELHRLIKDISCHHKLAKQDGESIHILDSLAAHTRFDFIHADEVEKGDFKHIADIYFEDPNFKRYVDKYPSLKMSERASFLRGSIRMTAV